jgi:N6-adenosine-specific RNA methylase IME4
LRAATPPLPGGPFDLIYADPPWLFRDWSWEGTGRKLPYAPMDLAAICRLPVAAVAAPDSVLAIWVNDAEPAQTLRVIEAWGFGPANGGLVWVKVSRAGVPSMGLGHSTRKDTEQLWLAKRGNGLLRADKGVAQTIIAQRREHSRKPDEAYHRLERLYGEARRLELFGRRERPGWSHWGNQLLFDEAPRLPFDAGELDEVLTIID